MPQTREHMEICTLLGVRHGFVALTKTDMVDEEWLELAIDDIQSFTRDTFLEDQPIVPVSSVTGDGLPQFVETLQTLCLQAPERKQSGLFRLPVDRVFTMKGFGTVITGSLVSGKIAVGETIMIYPSGTKSKVRGVQVHGQSVNEALAGQRTAVNFQGLDMTAVNRGDVLARPDTLCPSYMADLSFQYLTSATKPLKNRTRIRFHTGTSEIMGNLILLDRDELAPGETAAVQVRLDTPVSLVKEDRYVIRSYSPVRTIGGGQVLNPIPTKHKRFRSDITDALSALVTMPPDEVIDFHARQAGFQGTTHNELRLVTNLPDKKLDTVISALLSRRVLIMIDRERRLYVHADTYTYLRQMVLDQLQKYHGHNPLKAGMPREELRSKFPSHIHPKLAPQVLNQMLKGGELAAEGDIIRLATHKVSLALDQSQLRTKIQKAYAEGGITPPYFKDICQALKVEARDARDVLHLLVEENQLVKVKEELYFQREVIDGLRERLVAFLRDKGTITTPEFKDMTGASRKYVIPLAEYFDAVNVTLRVGDTRQLRKG
jgi:selenocysteine-specific elongation factor